MVKVNSSRITPLSQVAQLPGNSGKKNPETSLNPDFKLLFLPHMFAAPLAFRNCHTLFIIESEHKRSNNRVYFLDYNRKL